MMNEAVSTIMSTDLTTLDVGDKLTKAEQILLHQRTHHLPITEKGMLKGLLTTHDLYRIKNSGINFYATSVADVMTCRVATLDPSAKVGTAVELLLENLFNAIPIVKDGKLMGIVTSFDLLKYSYNKEYPNSWWLQKTYTAPRRATMTN